MVSIGFRAVLVVHVESVDDLDVDDNAILSR